MDPTQQLVTSPSTDGHRESVDRFRRPTVWQAMSWHWVTVVVPAVLLCVLAIAAGMLRTPNYTAETTLSVSQSAAGSGGLVGFADASSSLAIGFSRAINAAGVVQPTGRRTGLSPDEVRASLSASPIPQSPVVTVQARTDSSSRAVRLANEAAQSLTQYVSRFGANQASSARLLQEFQVASDKAAKLNARVRGLEASGAGTAAVSQASTQRDVANLQANAFGTAYQQSAQNGSFGDPLQVVSAASNASSDRIPKLELLAIVGLLAGLAVGTALAVYRVSR